jgi:hypothetical protein
MMPDETASSAHPAEATDAVRHKGQFPNLRGRARGSRNKLAEAFLKDMLEDWQVNGKDALERFRNEQPGLYVKTVASLLPRHFNIKVNEFDEYTDEQLRQRLDAVLARIRGGSVPAGAGAPAQGGEGPTLLLPALSEAG